MRAPLIFFLVVLSAGTLRASENLYGSAGEGNPLDGENPFARPSVFGPAFSGVADDATALFSNPAGLAFSPAPQMMTNTDFWLLNTVDETLLWGFPAAPHLGLAFGGQFLSFGSLNGYDDSGASTGAYSANRVNLQAGAGLEIFPQWGLGLEFQTDWNRLDTTSGFDASWGAGLSGHLSPQFRIGASLSHAGLFSSDLSLSTQAQAGCSYLWVLDSRQTLLTALGGGLEGGTDSFLQGGVEYSWSQSFFLRLGYRESFQDTGLGGLAGFTVGTGVVIGDLKFDYAYLPQGDLGGAHRITVGYSFAAPAPPQARPAPFFWPPPPLPPENYVEPSAAPASAPPPAPEGDSLSVESQVTVDPLVAGQALEKEGKYKDAMEFYQSLLKDQPANEALWIAMGKLYAKFNQFPQAAVCFRRALQIKPGDPEVLRWSQVVGGQP